MQNLIVIKGGKDGLRVQLDAEAEWLQVVSALREQLDQSGHFFQGAQILVDVGERVMNDDQLAEMLTLMGQHGVQPEALMTTARESRNAARSAGLRARVAPPADTQATRTQAESEAIVVVRTVRSGQIVRHQGHITLIGDVNPGAEVIAGGSVIVWGRLRGLVHAGALGDRSALICALELRPTQLRIANLIARTPEGQQHERPLPEVASVAEERIIVESWDHHRR